MAAPKRLRFRRTPGMPGLLNLVQTRFERIPDLVRHRKSPLLDHPTAGMAMFFFKFPSMLAFDRDARGAADRPELVHNLKTLFGIGRVPCDTSLRERLDEVDPQVLRPAFKAVFSEIQRGKGLERMPTVDGRYLVSVDGTEYFCSRSIGCRRCSRRAAKRRGRELPPNGLRLPGRARLPRRSAVHAGNGSEVRRGKKNDCESNAIKRLLSNIRREHPHPEVCALMDGPRSKAPQVRLLREMDMAYIIGAKRRDHKILYERLDVDGETCEIATSDGIRHVFRRPAAPSRTTATGNSLWAVVPEYREHIPKHKVRKAGGRCGSSRRRSGLSAGSPTSSSRRAS